MVKRPILIITLGYIIGIIIGLYYKTSIVFFCVPIVLIIFILSKLKCRFNSKLNHYISILQVKRGIIIGLASLIISNTIVLMLNYLYEVKFEQIGENKFIAIVASEPKEKQYYRQYKIKLIQIGSKKEKNYSQINISLGYKDTYIYLNVNKGISLNYGDKIEVTGTLETIEGQRNYKGFNYRNYLKSIEIFGKIKSNSIKVINTSKINIIDLLTNKFSLHVKNVIRNNIQDSDNANLLLGILLGEDEEVPKEIIENFQNSSLSHILAVSGMHVSYIILGINFLFIKMKFNKKKIKILTIIFLIFFMNLTGGVPSVKRACIMSIMSIRCNIVI